MKERLILGNRWENNTKLKTANLTGVSSSSILSNTLLDKSVASGWGAIISGAILTGVAALFVGIGVEETELLSKTSSCRTSWDSCGKYLH